MEADPPAARPRLRSISPFVLTNLFSALSALGWVLIFSRGLRPSAYGEMATILVCASLAQALGFHWLQTSILRFHTNFSDPQARAGRARSVVGGYLLAALAVSAIWIAPLLILPLSHRYIALGLCGLPVVLLRGWVGAVQSWNRVTNHRWRYAQTEIIQSLGSVALAVPGLLFAPQDPKVPLAAIALSTLVAAVMAPTLAWEGLRAPGRPWSGVREMMSYGGPLGVLNLTSQLLATSDRLLIAGILGTAAVGGYAIGYTLADRSVSMLILSITTATKPMAFMEFERGGDEAARRFLSRVGALLAGVGVPAAIGLAMLSGLITDNVVGPAMDQDAAMILPWAAVGALLSSMLMWHYGLAFQIARRTWGMLFVMGPAMIFNIAANLLLLPRFGVIAAAWTTVASYGLAIVLALVVGGRHFRVPFPLGNLVRAGIACVPMVFYLRLPFVHGWGGLGVAVMGGAAIYGCGAILLDIAGIRTAGWDWLQARRAT